MSPSPMASLRRYAGPAAAVAMLVAVASWVARGAYAREVAPPFMGEASALPEVVASKMRASSWREGCPVTLAELAYVRISHWGYDGAVHEGELVVAAALAAEVIDIFRDIYQARFPIEKMRLVDEYGGDDEASMADNNTSAFNCRAAAGRPGMLSQHAFGRAIDVNPVVNPFVGRGGVSPPGGAAYVDRARDGKGLIRAGDPVSSAFTRRGWTWGGTWRRTKDYQHFEKKAPAGR